jgi:shikimate kinase
MTPSTIILVGPGGAGKSTVGAVVAVRLGFSFADLDRCFSNRVGDISAYIDRFGYHEYARTNVDLFRSLMSDGVQNRVVALSSGFMTYPAHVHPDYPRLWNAIERSPGTVVLIPSLDRDICVDETVRRQLARPFARSSAREEAVIRERFSIYVGLRAPKIETMRSIDAVAADLLGASARGGQ